MIKNEEKNLLPAEVVPPAKPKAPPRGSDSLDTLLGGLVKSNDTLIKGLANLASLPAIDDEQSQIPSIFQKPFTEGVMGFRREGGNLGLTVACGTAQARTIPLSKYAAMVENMHEKDRPTIVLQNPSDHENNRTGRGQLLGRIIPASSALVIGLGFSGRIIEKLDDFIKVDVYYLSRSALAAFYIASKIQLSTENTLNELITAYEGWFKFGIPLNPNDPNGLMENM